MYWVFVVFAQITVCLMVTCGQGVTYPCLVKANDNPWGGLVATWSKQIRPNNDHGCRGTLMRTWD